MHSLFYLTNICIPINKNLLVFLKSSSFPFCKTRPLFTKSFEIRLQNYWISMYTYEVSSIKNANLSMKYEGIELQMCLKACKKGINVVVRFQYSEIGCLENSTFHSQLSWTKKEYPGQYLEDEPSAASSASSSSKTLWGLWGCRQSPTGHVFRVN